MKSLFVLIFGLALGLGTGYALWGTAVANVELPSLSDGGFPPVSEIEWDDGDSGRLRFEGHPFDIDFRVKDWDAPETGGVGAAVGAAKCEQERELGRMAERFVEELTKTGAVKITAAYGRDRTARKRHLVDIAVDDVDLAFTASEAGYLKSWRHEDGTEIESRPNWCESDR
ncbi:MAG: hypothetical protein AAF996_16450 [Pseudomonadota bacterium]